ncbi:MAG TPA: protein-L-isoaspartate(D-aspartate) O-methyltransferase [Chitinophagaceae bacterium]|jgi:protein-L-isoaspartate(D-aspartate) O-methyltransferase|nr:protein-L-isoaspartate(D-aspartate) O-methyltransferase [Chitinophagaceae bacterium]
MRQFNDTAEHRRLREQLVQSIAAKGITDERVLSALGTVPRQFFMQPEQDGQAYEDRPFPIGEGQTISQPYTVAYQTQLLGVRPSDRVLEIGTGSAYQAVVLSLLAAEVFTVERRRRLFERNQGFAYLQGFTNLFFFYGDGYEGLPRYAPFDRILITAAAPVIPPVLVEQLKPGGTLVLPLGRERPQIMTRVTREAEGTVRTEHFDPFSFVPMLEGRSE